MARLRGQDRPQAFGQNRYHQEVQGAAQNYGGDSPLEVYLDRIRLRWYGRFCRVARTWWIRLTALAEFKADLIQYRFAHTSYSLDSGPTMGRCEPPSLDGYSGPWIRGGASQRPISPGTPRTPHQ